MSTFNARMLLIVCILMLGAPTSGAQTGTITIGSAVAAPGDTVNVAASISTIPKRVGYAQNELVLFGALAAVSRSTSRADCRTRDIGDFPFRPEGCVPDVNCDKVRATVFLAASGELDNYTLYMCNIKVRADANPGTYAIGCINALVSGEDGASLVTCVGGFVKVTCTGDCDRDGNVTIDEVLRGVAAAIGDIGAGCDAFDADRDTYVTIDELVRAVNCALENGTCQ